MNRIPRIIRGRYGLAGLLLLLVVALLVALRSGGDNFEVPDWAYPLNPAAPAPAASAPAAAAPADGVRLRVPNSRVAFTRAQLTDLFAAPDWFPQAHPPMPLIVASGRRPKVFACAFCHLPDGQGRPENAPLAGLPAAYIVAQVADFRSGARRSASRGPYLPAELMRASAEHATDAEVRVAAEYFAGQRMTRRVEVVETERVPVTRAASFIHVTVPGAGSEALGERLLEVPADHERHELRDPAVPYLAYVPPGSITRGRRLSLEGKSGAATACGSCHGPDLRGLGLIPPLAGRSPSYLLRQLLAFRTGARATALGQPMRAVAAELSLGEMVDVAAYAASLAP